MARTAQPTPAGRGRYPLDAAHLFMDLEAARDEVLLERGHDCRRVAPITRTFGTDPARRKIGLGVVSGVVFLLCLCFS